ncbi:dynein regulation protein LC7 [Virgisporangium aurantiacum]|uniref:Dynein regulation protein LC7 n=2 Tax=Virgisporangium aurantiacum TaxID=175570 RepID=A0A8J3ZD78_9ACTN|nr:roadblock/LC7 domain-containing protein [Virgisporangium aurantiacum]GIJ60648.1 dynein regulation protein LC7 [Virgisporangium aurantiacum]
MPDTTSRGATLDWLLDDLLSRVPSTRHAAVMSADGLLTGASAGLGREDAEHLAAIAAGYQSLGRGSARRFGGGKAVRQTIVEMESGFMFVTAAGHGACLAVIAGAEADIGVIAYEMAMLVTRVGPYLATPPRAGAHGI